MTKMTNTLFRFATMRSPELLSEVPKERYFVYHPNPTGEGHFKSLVASPIQDAAARTLAWKNLAATFGAFQSPAQVKAYLGNDFFTFTNWLSKNATAINEDASLIESMPGFGSQQPLAYAKVIALWDNLFYQLISNKSSYVRDLLINALIANHFLNSSTFENQNKTALSRVVVPQEFYGVASLPSGSQAPVNPPVYTRELQRQLDAVVANEKLQDINALISELRKAQDAHSRFNLIKYNEEKTVYEDDLANKRGLEQPSSTALATDLSSVDFPRFEFTPSAEVDEGVFTQYLSEKSRQLARDLGVYSKTSFEDVFKLLTSEQQKQGDIGFEPEALSNRVININNVILPVEDVITLPGQQYSFTMQVVPLAANLAKVVVAIDMGYANADAVYALYHAETVTGTNTNGGFTDVASGNTIVMQLYPTGFTLGDSETSFRLHGEIRFSNGLTLLFDTIVTRKQGATGRMTIGGTQTTTETEDYVPLGFGIKRLGIADYRKVEQTTCCYVPGEVSHIENIMAREYKEKSTRRLRRSEDTTTISKETEKEELTDTTSTDRYEMNQQVSEVINKDLSVSLGVSSNFKIGPAQTSLTSNFAYNTSTQHSNSQAVSIAKDVTERALERVVQKVREERILKIVEEFEEQNKHGFDNRKGNQHVSGVYRWIDKIYKNQVYNYGKRLMYEFMIPQPAVFHAAAMKNIVNGPIGQVLEKPIDPRTAGLVDYRNINEATAAKWAATYGAEIEALVDEYITISQAFNMNIPDAPGHNYTGTKSFKLELPDVYESTGARVTGTFQFHPDKDEASHTNVRVGDAWASTWGYNHINQTVYFGSPIRKEIAVSAEVRDLGGLTINVMANCRRTAEELRRWQISCFNEIIKGYEKKLQAYNDALASITTDEGSKGTNPGFFRIIENTVLRKNCITYLVGQNNLGKKFYSGSTVDTILPDITNDMDRYTGRAKFIEQAFEWDLMSYTFYPFYWGDKSAWQNMYQAEVDDPLFRSFLQAGAARAVVTVRPGFEEAVMHYMATGQVWNGGQVPVIGDDLYLSIVEELKNPTFYVDETWESRVPTTLTVIQSGSIGLDAQGLPCDCGDNNTGINQKDVVMIGESNDDGGGGGANPPVFGGADVPQAPAD